MSNDNHPRTLAQIDWDCWDPFWRATLLFIVKGDQILLIEKKRGFGSGKINGPGGRLEPGETPDEAAVREVQEELCITPLDSRKMGELYFQFTDGLTIHGFVYTATEFSGTPTETDEAVPVWHPVDDIPYHRMWADDRFWMPLMLNGQTFDARFVFEEETILDQSVTLLS